MRACARSGPTPRQARLQLRPLRIDADTNFDTEQVVPTPDDTAQQSMGMWYYCSISLTAVLVADDVWEVLCTVGTVVAAAPAVLARWLQRTQRSSSALLWPAGDGQPASRTCGELVALCGGGAATAGTLWPGGVG